MISKYLVMIGIKKSCNFDSYIDFGQNCANEILQNGGKSLMEELRKELKVK